MMTQVCPLGGDAFNRSVQYQPQSIRRGGGDWPISAAAGVAPAGVAGQFRALPDGLLISEAVKGLFRPPF
jgi:hypothetical protein